jgi:ABC-2 type transport system ATP-binding protein
MNTIEIKGLCKSYEGFSFDNLSLILPRGCIMGLIGENGAGKSTTIKLILNIIRRDSGEIKLFGEDNSNPALKEDIGVVLDEVGIFSSLNAVNVGKIMSGIYKNWEDQVYNGYIERLELPKKKEFGDYSRGMKMKLGIAVALSHKPKLLILDEATSGLDPVVRDEVLNIFSEFTRDESC